MIPLHAISGLRYGGEAVFASIEGHTAAIVMDRNLA